MVAEQIHSIVLSISLLMARSHRVIVYMLLVSRIPAVAVQICSRYKEEKSLDSRLASLERRALLLPFLPLL